ncbi:MAG: glycosyltransferase [Candidatus Eremiobacteraeota bacterium]|nr:glycosyltransferase [Candidatus Eremiobacteraeota bacterium]MBV9645927.1 glycosyltransferase [Candidatus Eremiobacteraeota bacterium]
MTKRVLLLISDTGGGHRSAATAIAAALDELPGNVRFEHRIEDVSAHCTFPLSHLGPAYSAALRFAPPIYGALYHATNGRRRFRSVVRFCEPLYRERLRELFKEYQPDVIVSVHPLLNHASLRARADAGLHAPVVTVVTDLGRVHEGWLTPEVDAVVVPAREVYQRARERGIPETRLRLIGHPVHPRFEDVTESKMELRAALGLPADKTIALLMAGGEGGGKLLPTTLALARSRLPLHLVVVTGRNAGLRARLEELAPSLGTPLTILGYSNEVPALMRAADLLVTKAGPGTLAEASIAEVPVVVYDFVPGQERGNLEYVRTNGIGVVALTTADVVRSVRRIVSSVERLRDMRERQGTIAPRGSSRRIAELIAGLAITGDLEEPPPQRRKVAAASR